MRGVASNHNQGLGVAMSNSSLNQHGDGLNSTFIGGRKRYVGERKGRRYSPWRKRLMEVVEDKY